MARVALEHLAVGRAREDAHCSGVAFAARDLGGVCQERLSYSKVRALTRVAHSHDEDLLVKHALDATAAQVEERRRQIRNVAPDSVHRARRAWERVRRRVAR